jgi:hypothetical protein
MLIEEGVNPWFALVYYLLCWRIIFSRADLNEPMAICYLGRVYAYQIHWTKRAWFVLR